MLSRGSRCGDGQGGQGFEGWLKHAEEESSHMHWRQSFFQSAEAKTLATWLSASGGLKTAAEQRCGALRFEPQMAIECETRRRGKLRKSASFASLGAKGLTQAFLVAVGLIHRAKLGLWPWSFCLGLPLPPQLPVQCPVARDPSSQNIGCCQRLSVSQHSNNMNHSDERDDKYQIEMI